MYRNLLGSWSISNAENDSIVQGDSTVIIPVKTKMCIAWSIFIGAVGFLIGSQIPSRRTSKGLGKQGAELLPVYEDVERLRSNLANLTTLPSDVEIGPRLGSGSFGQVFKGTR